MAGFIDTAPVDLEKKVDQQVDDHNLQSSRDCGLLPLN